MIGLGGEMASVPTVQFADDTRLSFNGARALSTVLVIVDSNRMQGIKVGSVTGFRISSNRPGTVATVNRSGRQSGTSSHRSGVDTRASGVARTEYAEATVRSLAFWLKSTNTPSRSSFHQCAVASSGARRSTSRATVSAASRTFVNGQCGWMRA